MADYIRRHHQSNLILEDLIIRDAFPFSNLDVVLSGSIPPNPAELLMNERMEVLLNQAKSIYDIVIVDTAPTILVTDTLLISQLADVTVYMLRAGVTDKRLLDHIQELYKSEKLRKVGLVINGVKNCLSTSGIPKNKRDRSVNKLNDTITN